MRSNCRSGRRIRPVCSFHSQRVWSCRRRNQACLANLLRYVFDPRVDGYIDNVEATLSLANCCIWYLCQNHHDPYISYDDIKDNIIAGDYQLHEYAVTMWLKLVRIYVNLTGSRPLSGELIYALECLVNERSNNEFANNTELASHSYQWGLEKFKEQWPELYTMLCHVAHFHWQCSTSQYLMSKSSMS